MSRDPSLEMLSEPVVVPDTYCSSLAHIEELDGGNFRLTFAVRQRSLYGGGEEHVVVSRLIVPEHAVHGLLATTANAVRKGTVQ